MRETKPEVKLKLIKKNQKSIILNILRIVTIQLIKNTKKRTYTQNKTKIKIINYFSKIYIYISAAIDDIFLGI